MSITFFPCDILFIHRDAEAQPWHPRQDEVQRALEELHDGQLPLTVCVIPVRMQEARLLFDEAAIKAAAVNRNYAEPLDLPNPKAELRERLRQASGLSGRRLKRLNVGRLAHFVAQNIENYEPLRQLEAFRRLEQDVRLALGSL